MRFILVFLLFYCVNLNAQTVRFLAEDFPPLHFINGHGHPDGALVELTKRLIQQAGIDGEIEIMPQARALQELKAKSNVLLMSLLKTPEREPFFHWIGESYETQAYLISKSDYNGTDETLSPAKHTVATIRGYFSERYLKQQGFEEGKNLLLVSDDKALWQALFKNRSQFILTNTLFMEDKLAAMHIPIGAIKRAISLKDFPSTLYFTGNIDGDQQLHDRLSDALNILKKNGQYQAILEKWHI